MSNITNLITTGLKAWVPQITSVRFRYYADKKRIIRRYGYKELIDQRGLLAHTGGDKTVRQIPVYRPQDAWSERKSTFGQNDYLDILGSDEIKLKDIMYRVPSWVRGIKGNELQMLIRKRKVLQHGIYPYIRPTKWKLLNQRILFLWKYMNRKTKTFVSPR